MSAPDADTHNLAHLLDLCSASATWAENLREAEELTPYAITTRYPGEDEEVDQEETERAIRLAGHVRTTVREAMRGMGISLSSGPTP